MRADSYTIGDFLTDVIDISGFNLVDSLSAMPEIVIVFFIGFMGVIIWKSLKR